MAEETFAGKHILIIVENLPVPFDRRVWQEANTLKENGAIISIICPIMKGYTKRHEVINDINIYRHPLSEGNGLIGYLLEYSTSIFWWYWLSLKIFLKRPFHVIHGCNPPDLIFLVAIFYKLFRVKYVFDHHDINPEFYVAKFNKKGFFYKLLLLVERLTFATANISIATNESFKEIAIRRGKMDPDNVNVVRSGPKLDRLKIIPPIDSYKKGKKYLIGYVGVISETEGLDLLLESIKYIVEQREDVHFAIVGGGIELEKIQQLSARMNLNSYVDFYGRVDDKTLVEVLNTADVCVNPDRPTDMNNLSTMNKIMEYMALKKPIVQYDLKEGRFSAEKASLYATNTDTLDFANKVMWLLDNPIDREIMGNFGYDRVVNKLAWSYESVKLVNMYKRLFNIT
jgi:glycosyltransferase involved in cell wall biosynthesis